MVVLTHLWAPQEGIRHEEPDTTVYVNDKEIGKGILYITESLLTWVNGRTQQGFSLDYPRISLHAISRDLQVHPRQCLYIMVDTKVDLPGVETTENNENNSSGDEDDDPETQITEMRFAPDNTANLEPMFQAMNQCQALHPDPQDSFSDAEEDDIYEDAEDDDFSYYEVGAGDGPYIIPTANDQIANHNGTEVEEAMDVEAGQFEDAEEDP